MSFSPLWALAVVCLALPAHCQQAAPGESGRLTEPTWHNHGASQISHDNRPYDRSRLLGTGSGPGKDTLPTSTRDYLQNSGGLERTTTRLIAPDSVDGRAIGRQAETLGFPRGVYERYTGPYRSGEAGGLLPYTSTAAVDITVVGGEPAPVVNPELWNQRKAERGVHVEGDDYIYYGTSDGYGFFE